MSKTLTVVTTCYNALPVASQAIEAVLHNTCSDLEYIVVNNNNPDGRICGYLNSIRNSNLIVLHQEKNLGCHAGYNLGFSLGEGQFFAKVDDDTVVPDGWDKKLINFLEDNPEFAYIAGMNANIGMVEPKVYASTSDMIYVPKVDLNVVGFSCMMMPRKTWEEFGPFLGYFPQTNQSRTLYGGEESYYGAIAKEKNKLIGYHSGVKINHLGNEDRDIDYVLWKYMYGYLGRTKENFDDFRKDKVRLKEFYLVWLTVDNGWYQETAKKRLKELEF